MDECPIAYWKKHRPNALALGSLTYEELDELVGHLATRLATINSPIIACIPEKTPQDIALFLAAWRVGKALYPISHRLPEKEKEKRIRYAENEPLKSSNIATLIETSSGTKIACHTLDALYASAREAINALDITSSSSYCLNLPLFHISGVAILLRTFLAGAHLTFDPEQATHLSMVPTQLHRLDRPLPLCQCLLVGGAPLGTLGTHGPQKGLPIYQTYGMTEMGSMVALKKPNEKTKILPHVQLKLADDGEIFLKGESLFTGYFGQEKHEGWFATKDLGTFQEGELTILGRKDRQFISGGENIQPEEIERALRAIEGIEEARVTPKEDPEYGQVPIAQVFTTKTLDLKEVKKLLEKRLPHFKIPKTIEIQDSPLKGLKMADEPLGKGN